jgi:hypothetical protein
MPYVAEYSGKAAPFDCALSGPFDGLRFTRLSAPRALWRGTTTVISASTVYFDGVKYSTAGAVCQGIFLEDSKEIRDRAQWEHMARPGRLSYLLGFGRLHNHKLLGKGKTIEKTRKIQQKNLDFGVVCEVQ